MERQPGEAEIIGNELNSESEGQEQIGLVSGETQTVPQEISPSQISSASEKPKRRRRKSTVETSTPNNIEHIHHWEIDEPEGPTSTGHCNCGVERQFRNWDPSTDVLTNDERRMGAVDF